MVVSFISTVCKCVSALRCVGACCIESSKQNITKRQMKTNKGHQDPEEAQTTRPIALTQASLNRLPHGQVHLVSNQHMQERHTHNQDKVLIRTQGLHGRNKIYI